MRSPSPVKSRLHLTRRKRQDLKSVVYWRMSAINDPKAKFRLLDEQEVVQIQKDMEARRLDMLKLMEDSKAKLKSLLRTNQLGP